MLIFLGSFKRPLPVYSSEVMGGKFPGPRYAFKMPKSELKDLKEML